MSHGSATLRDDAAAFRRLRYGLGLLGLLLPLILALSGRLVDGAVQPTISDVFHTTQRDLLVGGLTAIGVFLAVHRGWRRWPGRWVSPDLIVVLAGLAAMGVAFFPNESNAVATTSQKVLGLQVAPILHYGAALLLYLMMSMTCFLAYAPDAEGRERQIYVWSGRVIFASGIMVMVLSGIKNNTDGALAELIVAHNLVFWDESVGVWVFSACWLLKAWSEGRREAARNVTRRDGRGAPGLPWPARPTPPPGPRSNGSWFAQLMERLGARRAPLVLAPGPVGPAAQESAATRHRRVDHRERPRPRPDAPTRRRA